MTNDRIEQAAREHFNDRLPTKKEHAAFVAGMRYRCDIFEELVDITGQKIRECEELATALRFLFENRKLTVGDNVKIQTLLLKYEK